MSSKQPTKATAKKAPAPAAKKAVAHAVKKQPPVKKAAAPAPVKKAAPPAPVKKAAAPAPVKKAAPPKKAAPVVVKKAAPPKKAAPVVVKKAAPPKKAPAGVAPSPSVAPAPVKKPKPITDKWLLEQQDLLQKERARLTHQAETLKAEADQLAEEMEPGDVQFDEESGEGNTVNIERERDLALSAQARVEIDEIDRALLKILDGTYGVCERCGQPIPKARLKVVPQATLCVPCKSGGLLRR